MNNRIIKTTLASGLALTATSCAISTEGEEKKPNLILIMADDLGYEALQCNGADKLKTPMLDKMAEGGVRFTNCFANPLCTPSRVKIMTGMYNVRNYIKFGLLDPKQTTFANLAKKVGYSTCIAGKWQLGNGEKIPQHFGFDQSCLWQHTVKGNKRTVDGKKYDNRYVNPEIDINGKTKHFTNGEYGPQVCTDFILDFIEKNKEKPFLVYYPMILTHCPFDQTPDSSDWDPKRHGSSNYKGEGSKEDQQRHFADMVSYTDKLVGQILGRLDKLGIRDNTIVMFTGDNGTDRPIVTDWKGQKVVGGKGQMTDNGTRVPLIVSCPGKIKSGLVTDDLVDFADFLPTICQFTGAPLPDNYPGDGKSIVPVLTGEPGREKPWVYVWYRGKVFARNRNYMYMCKTDLSDPQFRDVSKPFSYIPLKKDLNEEQLKERDKLKKVVEEISKTRPAERLKLDKTNPLMQRKKKK